MANPGLAATKSSETENLSPSGPRWWGAAVSAVTMVLVLCRLGNSGLWEDEGITGLLGAHILKYGLPYVQDGLLRVSLLSGDSRHGIWMWDGWLQAYLSAAGQALFGQTALGARFFHAIAGALVPWASYPFFRSMTHRPHVAEAATLLTGLSVPLFLYSRQAHYYPEAILLTVAAVRAYRAAWSSRRAWVALAGFMALLFHANFVNSMLLWIVFGLHLFFVRPEYRVMKRVTAAGTIWLFLVAPFAVWARIWDRTYPTRHDPHNPYYVLARLHHYLFELNLHMVPFALLFVAGAFACGRRRPISAISCLVGLIVFPSVIGGPPSPAVMWILVPALIGVVFLAISILKHSIPRSRPATPIDGSFLVILFVVFVTSYSWLAPYPYLRYLTPLIPFIAFLVAISAFTISGGHTAGYLIVGIALLTNALAIYPLMVTVGPTTMLKVAGALPGARRIEQSRLFTRTGLHDFETAFFSQLMRGEGEPKVIFRVPLAEFLGEITHDFHGPVDAIAGYMNARKRPGDRFYAWSDAFAIAFHTGLAPWVEPPPEPPRWLIPRIRVPLSLGAAREMVAGRGYREVQLDAVDNRYQNRAEPDLHRFRHETQGDRVVILERVDKTEGRTGAREGRGDQPGAR